MSYLFKYMHDEQVLVVKSEAVSASEEYVGESNKNNDGTGSSWRIRKIYTSSGVETVSYADGDNDFKKVWDDRASYNYI